MKKPYIEKRKEGYWIVGSRVSLDSVVYAFLEGQSAESIAQAFPVLSLEQVYGAIAYYLANKKNIDAYLKNQRADYEAKLKTAQQADPGFYLKLADARRKRKAELI
ncbi:DUF433 domain-containing protein [candidate division KSB1 bacterium]|nr:DUF433 domain-containing protein [candidate division KSB1 bacterium]